MSFCSLPCEDLQQLCNTLPECPCEGSYELRAGFAPSCRRTLSCDEYSMNSNDRDTCLLASICENKCGMYTTPSYCQCGTTDIL